MFTVDPLVALYGGYRTLISDLTAFTAHPLAAAYGDYRIPTAIHENTTA